MTTERLNALETEVYTLRRNGRMGWLVAVLFGAGLLMAAKGQSTMTAERFVVVDANGETRAILGTDGLNPSLTMFDAHGASATLGIQSGAPILTLHNGDSPRLTLSPGEPKDLDRVVEEPEPPLEVSEESAPKTDALVVNVDQGAPFTAIEVVCPDNGYRNRASFVEHRAVMEDVPMGLSCKIYFKGGPPNSHTGRGGDEVTCTFQGTQTLCRKG